MSVYRVCVVFIHCFFSNSMYVLQSINFIVLIGLDVVIVCM